MRSSLDGSIELDVAAATAYECWTRMEEFPRFIDAIESVRRIDAGRSVWRVNFGFQHQEWTAEITEVIPDKRRAWRSVSGSFNAGMVNFHPVSDDRTVMTLHLEYEPKGVLQNVGDELGIVSRVIQRALEQFKDFVENHA